MVKGQYYLEYYETFFKFDKTRFISTIILFIKNPYYEIRKIIQM